MPHKPKVYFLNKDGHNTDVELTADVFQTANIKRQTKQMQNKSRQIEK